MVNFECLCSNISNLAFLSKGMINEKPVHNMFCYKRIQSTLVISKSKGLSETLRDIRTLTYQNRRTEEEIIRTTKFHK